MEFIKKAVVFTCLFAIIAVAFHFALKSGEKRVCSVDHISAANAEMCEILNNEQ
jgi:hypothetical protein